MWKNGSLSWYLKPKQQLDVAFLRATDEPFFEASRRYGKTTDCLSYCIEELLQNHGHIVRWCEPWKNQCREIVMTEMDQIQVNVAHEDRFRWHQVDSYYEHPNGSRIYLRGVNEDRGESARGPKANIVVADELGSWRDPEYVLTEVLLPQLLTTKGKLIKVGTPPRNLTHPYYTMKELAERRGRFHQRLVYDQELVPWDAVEKFVAEMGGWDSPAVQRELLCKKVVDPSFSIVPEWNDKFIVDSPRDEYFPFYQKYTAMDIGVRDLTVILIAYYDFKRGKLCIVDEIVMNGAEMTTEKLAERNREKETEHFFVKWEKYEENEKTRWRMLSPAHHKIRRISDIDLLLVQDMHILHGLYYDPTDKGKLEEMVNEMRIWVGGGKVEVHPRCANLIDCCRFGLWDDERKKWERSEKLGHFDALAALMYLIRNTDRVTNPVPFDFGKPEDDYFYSEDQKAKRRNKFKKLFNIKSNVRMKQ